MAAWLQEAAPWKGILTPRVSWSPWGSFHLCISLISEGIWSTCHYWHFGQCCLSAQDCLQHSRILGHHPLYLWGTWTHWLSTPSLHISQISLVCSIPLAGAGQRDADLQWVSLPGPGSPDVLTAERELACLSAVGLSIHSFISTVFL